MRETRAMVTARRIFGDNATKWVRTGENSRRVVVHTYPDDSPDWTPFQQLEYLLGNNRSLCVIAGGTVAQ